MTAIHHLTRRGQSKHNEAVRHAQAASDANKAVLAALEGHRGPEQLRRSDAVLKAAITAHAALNGPAVTAPLLSATAGQIYPETVNPRAERRAKAEAAMRGAA